MNHHPSSPRHPVVSRRGLLAGSAAGALLALAGCGGGDSGGIAGIGTGGTGSFSSGPIRGFGSILVGDVLFDESSAQIVGDDGMVITPDELHLGMVADVRGTVIRTEAGRRRATATSIAVRSEILGPVAAIDRPGGALVVLGQQVVTTPATVFGAGLAGGIAALAAGQVVEIYGFLRAAGQCVATRIERSGAADHYKLRGAVHAHDAAARTFRIGDALISYANAGGDATQLADGRYARVELLPAPVGNVWQARRVEVMRSAIDAPESGRVEAEIEGYIGTLSSSARFSVGGIEVDASNAASVPPGLAVGRRVEVEGVLADGVLHAESVELADDDDDDFEIEGVISSVSPETGTFVVRGVTVDYTRAEFDGGTAARLAPGVRVEVEGRLAADGQTLVATEISFDD